MILCYLVGIASPYEGEDIQAEFCIYEDDVLLCEKSVYMDYVKPVLVGQTTLQRLLQELRPHKEKDITIIINDTPLYESLNGRIQKNDVGLLRLTQNSMRTLEKFHNCQFKNVASNPKEVQIWLEHVKNIK